jgi:hypothetical protein
VWRFSDIVVGMISGAVCSVLAGFIEGVAASVQVLSFGRVGAYGTTILMLALAGAVLGGIVGVFFGAVRKPRSFT